jgi:hypothetical protein
LNAAGPRLFSQSRGAQDFWQMPEMNFGLPSFK